MKSNTGPSEGMKQDYNHNKDLTFWILIAIFAILVFVGIYMSANKPQLPDCKTGWKKVCVEKIGIEFDVYESSCGYYPSDNPNDEQRCGRFSSHFATNQTTSCSDADMFLPIGEFTKNCVERCRYDLRCIE